MAYIDLTTEFWDEAPPQDARFKVLVVSESWTTPLFEKEKRQCFSSFSFGSVALRLIRYHKANKVVVIIATEQKCWHREDFTQTHWKHRWPRRNHGWCKLDPRSCLRYAQTGTEVLHLITRIRLTTLTEVVCSKEDVRIREFDCSILLNISVAFLCWYLHMEQFHDEVV